MFTLRVCYNMDSGYTLTSLEIESVMLAFVLLSRVNALAGKTNRGVELQRSDLRGLAVEHLKLRNATSFYSTDYY